MKFITRQDYLKYRVNQQMVFLKEESRGIYPIVVPVVIYTGFRKWKVPTNLAEKQYQSLNYKKYEIHLEYNLITVEDYTFEELLAEKTLFSSIMIIEKCKTKEEINTQMNKIIEVITKPKDREALAEIVSNIIEPIVGREKANKMLEKINSKEELEMSPFTKTLLDIEHKAWKKGKKAGITQEILRMSQKMLKRNMDINEIQEITGLSKEEIQKLVQNET